MHWTQRVARHPYTSHEEPWSEREMCTSHCVHSVENRSSLSSLSTLLLSEESEGLDVDDDDDEGVSALRRRAARPLPLARPLDAAAAAASATVALRAPLLTVASLPSRGAAAPESVDAAMAAVWPEAASLPLPAIIHSRADAAPSPHAAAVASWESPVASDISMSLLPAAVSRVETARWAHAVAASPTVRSAAADALPPVVAPRAGAAAPVAAAPPSMRAGAAAARRALPAAAPPALPPRAVAASVADTACLEADAALDAPTPHKLRNEGGGRPAPLVVASQGGAPAGRGGRAAALALVASVAMGAPLS